MLHLFFFFLKLGFISFGGGYALLPLIEDEALRSGWMTQAQFLDAVSIAGMSPGPIAVNAGLIIGYESFGWQGAALALIGLVLPSVLAMLLLIVVLFKLGQTKLVNRIFYGVQPVVVALIAFAAIRLVMARLEPGAITQQLIGGLFIVAAVFVMLLRYRVPPIYLLVFSGISGAAFFS
ncbi:chromate transporter [Paenibacillus sp. IB182496]|uniref:Chromate transporter n=1 Tax=Paenibacillus sabuli TaxID=2772509 RepID=A0A927BSK1_9BACL|nr:chromate transporter [Paenibacillus sabuli]MBD2845998.1 chromate transporter [Paenibacillus sabuli]